jgi:predicted NAD/FAD-dependent oxidoreductase
MVRPGNKIIKNLWACGDYLEGPYPSTIEGAVMSGIQVAKMVACDL